MEFFIAFLEGIVTFISPCLLPMIPLYASYFAAGKTHSPGHILRNALGFVLGFTIIFVALGALAGTLGSFLAEYRTLLDFICGIVVIFFGLYFLGVIKLNIFKGINSSLNLRNLDFFSSTLFGIVFSIGWTPCVGAFLGSALALASQQATLFDGTLMLLSYSAGLGIPFVLSALLINSLKSAFAIIKRHYGIITKVCGWVLVGIGILMATGLLGGALSLLG